MMRRSLVCALLTLFSLAAHAADTLLIAAGAGYKRPLAEIAAAFEARRRNRRRTDLRDLRQALVESQRTRSKFTMTCLAYCSGDGKSEVNVLPVSWE